MCLHISLLCVYGSFEICSWNLRVHTPRNYNLTKLSASLFNTHHIILLLLIIYSLVPLPAMNFVSFWTPYNVSSSWSSDSQNDILHSLASDLSLMITTAYKTIIMSLCVSLVTSHPCAVNATTTSLPHDWTSFLRYCLHWHHTVSFSYFPYNCISPPAQVTQFVMLSPYSPITSLWDFILEGDLEKNVLW